MSDEENTPPTAKTAAIPPPGSPKTSAVPLKKETVRITLRARPGAGAVQPREATSPVPTSGGLPPPTDAKRATAPIQLPSAPLPPPSPKSSTSPVSLPPAPIPPPGRKTMQVPTAPGAPEAPAAPAAPRPMAPSAPRPPAPAAPRMEAGAVTQPLTNTQPMKVAPRPPSAAPRPPGGTGTGPLAGGPTGALPKATQKLQATQPLARPVGLSAPQSAPVKRSMAESEQFYEEKDPDAGLTPISAFVLVMSVVLLFVQIASTDRVLLLTAEQGEDSSWKIPQYVPVTWETRNEETHEVKSKFKDLLRSSDYDIPQ